jgi:hypothetical protein
MRVGALVESHSEIAEMDLNPLIALNARRGLDREPDRAL